MGEKFSEIHKVGIILSSLPSSWDTLVTALEVREEKHLSIELVQSSLLDENLRKRRNDDKFQEKVLKVKSEKFKDRNTASNMERKQVFCYFCKGTGHTMKMIARNLSNIVQRETTKKKKQMLLKKRNIF